ncbi:hypothetical protein DJICPGNB_17925 [Escherichia coli]|nr:hypothetical protein DJICPGNB_17925 [Escherichia coli]
MFVFVRKKSAAPVMQGNRELQFGFRISFTFFYTDVFGLTPALVGTLFIALRVFDAISDPVIGVIADRTQSR